MKRPTGKQTKDQGKIGLKNTASSDATPTCVALSGGVGGAKLCLGLSSLVPGSKLAIIANCGDDFEHFGLHVSPDIDTVMYTLTGLANPEFGWGRADETWSFMGAMEQIGGETWFQLGDKDLATNVARTHRLRSGEPLSRITADLCTALGLETHILPATDDRLRTMLETDIGRIDFQTYLVGKRAQPVVSKIIFDGAESANPAPGVLEALNSPTLESVIICPSNPFVSVDPILAVPGITDALRSCRAPVISVSPIVGGKAIKGPAAKMFEEFGMQPSALEVARHYGDVIDAMIIDTLDVDLAPEIRKLGLHTAVTNTIMTDTDTKIDLARVVLGLAADIHPDKSSNQITDRQVQACG